MSIQKNMIPIKKNIRYYFPLFEVDANQVGKRVLYSFLPIKASFFNLIESKPDL